MYIIPFNWFFTVTLGGSSSYTHSKDEATRTQKCSIAYLNHTAPKYRNWDSDSQLIPVLGWVLKNSIKCIMEFTKRWSVNVNDGFLRTLVFQMSFTFLIIILYIFKFPTIINIGYITKKNIKTTSARNSAQRQRALTEKGSF